MNEAQPSPTLTSRFAHGEMKEWMSLKAGLDNGEKRKVLTSLGVEHRFFGHHVLNLLAILTELLRIGV